MTSYDLGMIRVFLLIYETGSVTTASQKLFISQPSVSYTLRKLRDHFSDPLFNRRGHHLEPTPLAQTLYPKLRRLVGSLDDVMTGLTNFDPQTSTRNFRLRLTDVGVDGLLAPTMRAVRGMAPHVTLAVESLNLSTLVEELRAGAADAAICTSRLDDPDVTRDVLFEQEYVGLCASAHPRISNEPTLKEYEGEQHLAVATSTGHTSLDIRARELGIQRQVVAVIPTFSSLPNLLEGSDLISYAPRTVARRFANRYAVRIFKLPFDVPVTEVAMYTLKRELPAADVDWLRTVIQERINARYQTPPESAPSTTGGLDAVALL